MKKKSLVGWVSKAELKRDFRYNKGGYLKPPSFGRRREMEDDIRACITIKEVGKGR